MKLWKISLSLCLFPFAALAAKQECRYIVDPASVKATWTAYKTSEKTPVSGTIKGLEVNASPIGSKIFKAVIAKTNVTGFIDKATKIDSGNPARDATLFEKFFKLIASQAKFRGAFNHIEGDEKGGSLNLQLSLNDKVKEIPMKYTFTKAGAFEATGEMDMKNFDLEKPLASLHEACAELHKGKDGVSKTWEAVGIKISAKINQDCGKKK